ncbi:MAG TPA: ABC transporter permease [Puia sp.]|jgi:ABC-type antimicrobial peptide transport system permease subunit
MIRNYFRVAFRNLWKNRSVNWINIIGLSAGMTSAVLIFLWVQNEMTYDAYHPQADRIYRTTAHLTKAHLTWPSSPLPLGNALKESVPEIEQTASIVFTYNTIFSVHDELFPEKNGAYVDKSWFDLFHYDFIQGSPSSFLQQPFSLLLTESKAKKYFGNNNPIGQTIRIDTVNYQVQAVVKDNPSNSSFQSDFLIPLGALQASSQRWKDLMIWDNFNALTFLKLRPGVDSKRIAAKITGITSTNPKMTNVVLDLEPIKEIHFETDLTSDGKIEHANRKTVYIFSILGIFLLVIACINYVNLTTARASLRAKEVSIRKIVGAGKQSLFIQFILESLLISALSILITVVLVRLGLPWFRELTGKSFTNPLASAAMWKIIGITLLTATFLNGIYPAVLLSSFQPLNVFKGAGILKIKDAWFRKSLVIVQFSFSVILIVCTLVIQHQLNYIQKSNPGYDRSQLFTFRLPWTIFKGQTDPLKGPTLALDGIKQELLSHTSIAGTTVANQSIVNLGSTNFGSADWDGHDTAFRPIVYNVNTDEDYKKVFRIELAQGRWFEPNNPMDQHNFIINETIAREFNIRQPIVGQRFTFLRDTGKIIGIVKDFHFASLHDKIAPLVIFNRPGGRTSFFVKTQPGKTPEALAFAKTLFQRYNPGKPFEYSFLDEEFDLLYKADAKLSTLILLFSIIAILISALGLFGLSAFTAEQRTKEIGIRKVLGATVTGIVALLSKDFLRLVGLSILIATPIAGWAMYKWLQDFAYHIPLQLSIFVLAGALAILIALVTISFQSIKAARNNPVKSLRTE